MIGWINGGALYNALITDNDLDIENGLEPMASYAFGGAIGEVTFGNLEKNVINNVRISALKSNADSRSKFGESVGGLIGSFGRADSSPNSRISQNQINKVSITGDTGVASGLIGSIHFSGITYELCA